MTSFWVASCAATLLAVANPARPWVLAVAVAGGGVLAMLVWDTVAAVRDRRAVRILASADTGTDVHDAIADLRTRISEIVATLEPDRSDDHEEVGRRIESALVWLDTVEIDAGPKSVGGCRS